METKIFYTDAKEMKALGTSSSHQTWPLYEGDCWASEPSDLPASFNPTGLDYGRIAKIANGYSNFKAKLLKAGTPMDKAEQIATFRWDVLQAVKQQLGWGIGAIALALEGDGKSDDKYNHWTWACIVGSKVTVEDEAAQVIMRIDG